jgi:pyrroline-5-carboxylate reductase
MSQWTNDLAIVGAGNMAEAIARGILAARLLDAKRIVAADLSPQRRELFTQQLGITTVQKNTSAVRGSRIVLLSVKPQQMESALGQMREALDAGSLIVSIAAGISTAKIARWLDGGDRHIIRAMPNTPMLVGKGMVALCRGAHATAADMATVTQLFEAAASVVEVDESQMDAVTAVSGSGPAYVFYLAEQMIRAGVAFGLSPRQARELALRTVEGAAVMLVKSDDTPEVLRKKVTSPGGTTQAAIEHMERQNVGPSIVDAIGAAVKRGKELGG